MRRKRLRNRPFSNKRPNDEVMNFTSSDEEHEDAASHSVISAIPSIMAVVVLNQSALGAGIRRQSALQKGIKISVTILNLCHIAKRRSPNFDLCFILLKQFLPL